MFISSVVDDFNACTVSKLAPLSVDLIIGKIKKLQEEWSNCFTNKALCVLARTSHSFA